MTTAELSQCMNALEIANTVRSSNAALKREIGELPYADGCQKVADLLAAPEGAVASMPIGRLLVCVNKIGEEGMTRFLRHAGIFSTTKRVGMLTTRQRRALIHALEDRTLLWPGTGLF